MANCVEAPSPRLSSIRPRRPFRLRIVSCSAISALVLAALVLLIPEPRLYVLKSTGRLIAADSPAVDKADIVIVAVDVGAAGTLEAADLVQRGVSDKVAVFQDPPTSVDREFLRRGVPYENRGAISTLQLRSLGVARIVEIPRASGSNEEGQILPGWCEQHGYRSAILVTSHDHSRRVSRIMRRSLHHHAVQVIVLSSPYSTFNPDSWWTSRAGVRIGIEELEKLLLDVLCHPFS